MSKKCFVYETLQDVKTMQRESTSDGFMHLKGVFGVCGVKNNNARIYEAGNYGKMVAEMKERIKKSPIPGELEHPQTMNITTENISHKIVDINIDENGVVSGEIVLLNTPKGKIAQEIVKGGLPLFISSRATGSVDPRTSIVTLETLQTYDLVGSPGFSQAELHLMEGQVAESLCESCGVVYLSENNNNNDMNEQQFEARLKSLESKLDEAITLIQSQAEEIEALHEELDSREIFNKKELCEGIQKWMFEDFAPCIQSYIVDHYSPEVEKWVTEHYSGEIEKWCIESFAPEVEKWVLEHYSPEIEKWCTTEFAGCLQTWFVNECAPAFENWVTEHYGQEVKNQISEAIKNVNTDSLSNIKNTLSMLEGLQQTKPTYGAKPAPALVVEGNAPKYIAEMPAATRVKYDLASQEIKESIDRRARLFDFQRHTVAEFWESVNFDAIKPTTIVTENGIMSEREKMIRESFRASWGRRSRH